MGQKTQHISSSRAGFTLMELLVVVALLAIIAAITAPALVPVFRSTEMGRLDATAKEMYVALQDQFIDMEASGEYKQFNNTLRSATTRNLGSLGTAPHDAEDNAWLNYYYLCSFAEGSTPAELEADAALAQIIARTPVVEGLSRGGRYIVEVNPRTDGTDVYAVFYSEDPSFSYTDVIGLASRERSDRMHTDGGYPIGYYCGLAATGSDMPDHFSPRATFVNGEELFLNITCPGGVGLVGSERNMVVKLVLSSGQAEQTLFLTGGEDFHLGAGGNLDIDIVLDSMRPGMHLADIFPDFTPGEDITATVEVEFDNGSVTISTPASARGQAKENSLYAKNIQGAIEVANVRHLNNLNLLPDTATAVTQVSNIYFNASEWGKSSTTELSSATKEYNEATYGTAYVNPLDPLVVEGASGFEPISPSAPWPYNGLGNALYGFSIQGSRPAGLFSTILPDQLVTRTTLVDPKVEGSGPVGALCGELYGQIDNCGVRLDITSKDEVSKVDEYKVFATSGENVGGLVGMAAGNSSISHSYAAIDVLAASSTAVGGLVGYVAGGSIDTCYASGSVDGADAVGGFVGVLDASRINECYATGSVYAGGAAGGFVGNALGGTVSACASYGRPSGAQAGGFTASEGASFSDCVFLEQINYNDGLATQPAGIEGKDYATLATTSLAADHSHPYNAALMGNVFPFANVLEDHWGNWPEAIDLNPVLVYYEFYGDGSYGFYGRGETSEGPVEINTLDDFLVVVEDGYALLCSYPLRGFDYKLNGGSTYRLTLSDTASVDTFVQIPTEGMIFWDGTATRSMDEMYVYQLPLPLQMPDRTATTLLDTLEITMAGQGATNAVDYTFYYNPDFAKLSSSPNSAGTTDVADTSVLLVRTARQLNRLGYQSAYWSENIAQERDIDYAYYTTNYFGLPTDYMNTAGSYANVPIGRAGEPFTGTFDGQDCGIIDYSLRAEGYQEAGFFGEVSGTVRNVHLGASLLDSASVVRTGSADGASTVAVGALVGWLNGGLVSGCSVAGYQLFCESNTALSDAALGGLVGVNLGSVTASSAADMKIYMYPQSQAGATLGVGGIVGSTQGSISQSYAVEIIFECQTSTTGSGRTIGYGGIAGYAYGGNPAISNCYAYCFVDATRCGEGDTVWHYAISQPASTSISNCFTMDVYSEAQDGSEVGVLDAITLQDAPLSGFMGSSTPRFTYGNTVPGHMVDSGYNYPYPVICKDHYGDWTHYGFSYR